MEKVIAEMWADIIEDGRVGCHIMGWWYVEVHIDGKHTSLETPHECFYYAFKDAMKELRESER